MNNISSIFGFGRTLSVAAVVMAGGLNPVFADDTELFRFPPGSLGMNSPNVLIMLDTSSNWSTRYVTEKAALMTLRDHFQSSSQRSQINVGLMNGSKGTNGGYVRSSIRSMQDPNSRSALFNTIASLDNSAGEKSNNPAPSNMFAEAFYYLTGSTVSSGTSSASDFRDFPNNSATGAGASTSRAPWGAFWNTAAAASQPSAVSYALSNGTASTYNRPTSVYGSCARTYIIYISNGPNSGSTDDASGCAKLTAAATAAGLSPARLKAATTQIPISPNGFQANCTDEWARFMRNYHDFGASGNAPGFQGVTTYSIEIEPKTTGQGPNATRMWKSVAAAGGGEYIGITDASNETQLQVALTRIFNQIQSQASVFASAALPVSVNQRSTNLNQVYIGLFNTDPSDNPRWPGNLKKYQLGYDESTRSLFLSDKSGVGVIDSAGQFKTGVSSDWTSPNAYWSGAPDPDAGISDGPDGGVVMRGGAAQLQRMSSPSTLKLASNRKVLTYTGTGTNIDLSSGSCSQCVFGTSNAGITQAATGTADATDLANLVNWVRGANNQLSAPEYARDAFGFTDSSGATSQPSTTISSTHVRPSVQGDVLHSRPALINYNRGGTASAPDVNDVVVFYGSNDGTLRAIQGGQGSTSSTPSYASGSEKWSFVAPEFFGSLNTIRKNNVPVSHPGQAVAFTTAVKLSNGSNTLTGMSSTDYAKVRNFQQVSGSGVPSGTYVLGKVTCPTGFTNCVEVSANSTSNANASLTFSPNPRPYFWDGSMTTHVTDANNDGKITPAGGDKAYIFATMRRGGRMIYAFDVTDPETPVFMWKRGCPNQTNNTGCSTGWAEIGQTWSAGTPTKLSAASNAQNLALVFGAGYDAGYEDADPRSGSPSMGRGVFVVDALTGSILRKFVSSSSASASDSDATAVSGLNHTVPSDVSVVARDRLTNQTVNAYRAYVGDTGGRLWRLDLSHANPAQWSFNKLLDANAAGRKFFFGPDVVLAGRDARGEFDHVLLGSGDREHPFQGLPTQDNYTNPESVQDWFFMFKDYNIGTTYSNASGQEVNSAHIGKNISDLYDTTSDVIETGTAAQIAAAKAAIESAYGWKVSLNGLDAGMGSAPGEKTVGGATTIAGVVYFTTNRPTGGGGTCGVNLGEAKLYATEIGTGGSVANYFNAAEGQIGRFSVIPGGGFPPTPVPVSMVIDGRRIEGVISGTHARTSASQIGTRVRAYVRRLNEKKN